MPNFLRDEKARNSAFQAAVLAVIVTVLVAMVLTAHQNLRTLGITSGFSFLQRTTGWDIPFYLIDYTIRDPYWRVLLIGFLNTLFIGLVALVFATVVGALVGVARIARNPLLRLLATCYVELFRNVPLILQAFFWYAIATRFPPPRRALEFAEAVFLSSRGIYIPAPSATGAAWGMAALAAIACIAFTRRRYEWAVSTGSSPSRSRFVAGTVLALLLVLVATVVLGRPAGAPLVEVPVLAGLRFEGGWRVIPEFLALLVAIVLFGSAYIAEIVRGGFNAVNRGTLEAARGLGLKPLMVLVHVHLPLALRAIVPPLGNMYVWLMKATTLGIAIGFSDLFMIVSTSINQSGQTIELLGLMMLGFFIINYTISSLMNALNRAIAIKGHDTDAQAVRAEL